jgi:hypothetical protein
MDDEQFKERVLDFMGRIDERMKAQDTACKICSAQFNKRLDGLEADVEKNHDDITGLSIKAATIGGAAGVIGALGFGGGWSWLSGLFK